MKTVAVTGATGTLGQAVMGCFEDKGWQAHGCSSEVDVQEWLRVAEWLNGVAHLDAMVTCAGVSCVKPSTEMTPADWEYVIAVNLTGTWYAATEAIKRGATRIVTIGSIHGCTDTSYPQRAAYTASKGGVAALTRALAVEYAPQGVAVNCVAPGHLPELMSTLDVGGDLLEAARQRTPMGKLATPEEVADVIFYLCDGAPLSVTGQILEVSGGFTQNTWPL
jgi:NAD(P)-dependent dehydrogenase (short-subunit alcohol dehydrogenase family)